MPGRPKNKAFKELGYLLVKTNNKYSALCTVCNKNLQNTAGNRLRGHRNRCKPQTRTSESDDVSMVFFKDDDDDEAGGAEPSSSDQYSSENAMSLSITNNDDKDYKNLIVNNYLEQDPLTIGSTLVYPKASNELSAEELSSVYQSQGPSTSSSSMSLNSKSSSSLPLPTAMYKANIQRSKRSGTPSNTVAKFVDRLSEKEESELNEALGKLVFGCNIPLGIVESLHFKNFIKKMRPAYAGKLPSRKELSTTILDRAYDKCISSIKTTMSSEAVLLIDGWENSLSNSKTLVSMLHNAEGEQAFLQAWDLTGESETPEKLSNILVESVDMAKQIYSTQVYAVVFDNDSTMKKMGKFSEHFIWHSTCSSHIGKLLAKDIVDKNLNSKVNMVLKEFKQADIEKMIIDRGGTQIKLPCETRWYSYRDSYKCLVENVDSMKYVTTESRVNKIKQSVASLLFDKQFIEEVKKYIELFDPVCTLINRCQAADCSAGEAVNLWLNLKLPDAFIPIYETSLKLHVDMALNKYALSAYYLHPHYDNTKLTNGQNEIVCNFLLKHLNGDGIEDWDCFNRKIDFFKVLYEKDIKKPIVFWNMAAIKHPNLANLAKKLLQIPASSAQIERVFSNWANVHSAPRNRLTFERSKKLLHLYYSLRIEDGQDDYFNEDDIE